MASKSKKKAKTATKSDSAASKAKSSVVSFTDFTKNLGQQFSDNFSCNFPQNFSKNFGSFAQDQFQIPHFNFMETFMSGKNMFEKMPFDKMTSDLNAQTRQQIEAMSKCSATLMKGMEAMMKTTMQMAQESAERNTEAMKSMMACKTVTEFTEAQNKLAQQNFDDMMKSATKMSEMCIKICTEAFEPVNDQLSKSIKKASEAMAA
jgi:phasin family protein